MDIPFLAPKTLGNFLSRIPTPFFQPPATRFQSQVQELVSTFVKKATDWRLLASMRAGRIGVMPPSLEGVRLPFVQ